MTKNTFKVEGMHCASCAMIIDKKLNKLAGIKKAEINFASEKAKIDFDEKIISSAEIKKNIKKIGYELIEIGKPGVKNNTTKNQTENTENKKENDLLKQKEQILFSLPLAILVFLIMLWDMGAKFFSWIPNLPLPMDLLNIILMILATIILFWIGRPFLFGIKNFVKYGQANMDTLIGVGTGSAYFYSALITLFPGIKQLLLLPDYTYFDVTIVVISFVILGKYLEAKSKNKTGQAINKLLNLQAKTAIVWRNNKESEISINEVIVGDIILVKPGGKIPVDGKIIEGQTSIDESMINGESVPSDKTIGDNVIGATINKQGYIKFRAEKIGQETMLAQIINLVEDAQNSKAPIQSLADRISSIFVPTVLIIALSSLLLWLFIGTLFLGQNLAISYGLLSFIGTLVIACPCALGLATPTAIIVGIGKGAENGILIKDAASLELLSHANVIVFDKTGTITNGQPELSDVVIIDKNFSENEIISLAGSVEKMSEHPLAQAIVNYAKDKKIELKNINNFEALKGMGVKAMIDNKNIYIRKPDAGDRIDNLKKLQSQGKTVVLIEVDKNVIGLIALSDTLKPEAKEVIESLHQKNIKIIMMTGDNYLTANYIAQLAGIKNVISEVLPSEKSEKIKELQKQGNIVAMIGDGINDSPALAQANIGIAMATGTDIAIESAGITLLHGDIKKIAQTITLSKLTIKTIKQNLFWAFAYNIIGIPLAAGLFYPLFGLILNPIFAGLAMALSSVSVVANSLRLKTKNIK